MRIVVDVVFSSVFFFLSVGATCASATWNYEFHLQLNYEVEEELALKDLKNIMGFSLKSYVWCVRCASARAPLK